MAQAVKQIINEYEVVLTLSRQEAETLLTLTHWTGGDDVHSRRHYADRMGSALKDAGVQLIKNDIQGDFKFT